MVFGVGDVEAIAGERQTLWTIESRFVETAVSRADISRSDSVNQRSVEFGNDNPIMVRVSNEQPIGCGVGEYLARKRQRQISDFRSFENKFQWLLIQLATFAKLRGSFRDRFIDRVEVALPRDAADDVPGRIYQDARWPGAHTVALPDSEFRVVV